ncbi:MAG: hypothetical protein WC447_01310 [Candidatus Paceibacterota bacterium]|jgi:hypothetical protein
MQEALPKTEEEKIIGELLKKSSELYLETKELEKKLNKTNSEETKTLIKEEIFKLTKEKNKINIQIGKIQSDLRNKN